MKAIPLIFLICIGHFPLLAKDDAEISQIFREAVEAEQKSFEAFGDAKAVSVAMTLKIPLETARQRVDVPPRKSRELNTRALSGYPHSEAALAQRRETLRKLQAEMDDMIAVTRQLLEELQKEEAGENADLASDPQILLDEISGSMEAAALAAEDSGERARDLTGSMPSQPRSPAAEARTDAEIAAQAARAAAASARTAKQKAADAAGRQSESPEAEKVASQLEARAETATQAASASAQAAQQSSAAAVAAGRAAAAGMQELERAAARESASASAEAVRQAIIAAIAAGELSPKIASFQGGEGSSIQAGEALSTGLSGSAASGNAKTAAGGEEAGGRGRGVSTGRSDLRLQIPDSGVNAPVKIGPTLPSRRIALTGEPGTGWIRLDTWYIIGPFPNPSRQNIDVSFPPESIIDLDATYFGDHSEPLRWEFVQSDSELVRPIRDLPYAIYYAYTEFWSDADRDLWVALGSDDNSRVWLNDHLIWKSGYGLKNWRPNEGFRRVRFQRGINRILYRVENGHGSSGFSFLIQIPSPEPSSTGP